jgi:Na+/proline symporter
MAGKFSIETGVKRELQIADYVVFAATLGLSAAIGVFYAVRDRRRNTPVEYLLGGRQMYVIPVLMSLLSTFVAAPTILGIPADVYTFNTMYWWIVVGQAIAITISTHVFLPIYYRLGIISIFEIIFFNT